MRASYTSVYEGSVYEPRLRYLLVQRLQNTKDGISSSRPGLLRSFQPPLPPRLAGLALPGKVPFEIVQQAGNAVVDVVPFKLRKDGYMPSALGTSLLKSVIFTLATESPTRAPTHRLRSIWHIYALTTEVCYDTL